MTHSRTPSTLSTRSECSQSELSLWRQALDQFDYKEYRNAYDTFSNLEPRAKVLYNMAMCALLCEDWGEAVECLKRCVDCDPYLAIAAYQLGCTFTKLDDANGAVIAFEQAVKVHYQAGI
jgi:tetratricopeptide (TPR) repeat protein